MPRIQNSNMYYPCQGDGQPMPMPPMQMQSMRSPCFLDDKPMPNPCGMPMGGAMPEFKSPPAGVPESPGVVKKKRKTSAATSVPTQVSPIDMMPPPPTGYGDTIVASNPFDDFPPQPPMNMSHGHMQQSPPQPQMHPMGHHHMGGGMNHMSGGMNHMGMGSMNMVGPPPMPPHHMNVGSPMNAMGTIPPSNSPMGNMGGNVQPANAMHLAMHHSTAHHPFGSPGMGPKPMPVSSGKVYPADQPMVFNPQNPNAPPIYPCGICHKEVHDNDQAILCESGCNFWFHRICTGLTEAAYQLLTAEVYAEWVCDKCLSTKNIPLVKFKP